MYEAITEMAGVIFIFIALYAIPIFIAVIAVGFLIWLIKH